MEEITVVKRVSFDAAHYLPDYPGKCKNMHGHHWVIELGVKGRVGSGGMVIDFAILKDVLKSTLDLLDHKLLNDFIPNPTAENICIFVKERVHAPLSQIEGCKLDFIKVWETEDSYAVLS